jgi:hypothetical protein
MTDRYEVQKELEDKLAAGEAGLEKLKAKMAEAGDDASEEMAETVAAAERALGKGKARLSELTAATDEEFEGMWSDTKDAWHEFSAGAERGWHSLSDRVKRFFA